MTTQAFAPVYGPELIRQGYLVQRSPKGLKHPIEPDWINRPKSIPDMEASNPTDGVNILTGKGEFPVGFIDVDCYRPELSEAFRNWLYEKFPALASVPYRVGRPPKFAVPFRFSQPGIAKIQSKGYTDEPSAEHPHEYRVEILGSTSQCMVYGIHPETGKPYEWHADGFFCAADSLADIPACDLPVLTPDDLRLVVAKAEELFSSMPGSSLVSRGRSVAIRSEDDETVDALMDKAPLPDVTPETAIKWFELADWDVDTYDSWRDAGSMCAHQWRGDPETGFEVFDAISQWSPKYKGPDDVRRVYESLRKNTGGRCITMRTLRKAVLDKHPEELLVEADKPTARGLSARFIQEMYGKFYFLADENRVLHFNGLYYVEDDVGEIAGNAAIGQKPRTNFHAIVMRAFDRYVREKMPAYPKDTESKEGRKALAEYNRNPWVKLDAKLAGTVGFVRNTIRDYILPNPLCRINSSDFDRLKETFAVGNGYINLRTGEFFKPDTEALLRKHSNVMYVKGAECPRWRQFMKEITCGDQEEESYLKRFVGYCMLGDPKEQLLHIFKGYGGNGKSVFLDAVMSLFGDYSGRTEKATLVSAGRLNGRAAGGASPDLASLKGKRLVCCTELDDSDKLKAGEVKALTGDQAVTARALYAGYSTFQVTWNLLIVTNNVPRCTDLSDGLARRLRIVDFKYKVPAEKRDLDLPKKLEVELSGILNWAVEGAQEYLRHGLKPTKAIQMETEQYKTEQDVVDEWIGACCVPISQEEFDELPKARQKTNQFWYSWKSFIQDRVVSDGMRFDQGAFTVHLKNRRGFRTKTGQARCNYVTNYKLRDNEEG